jgi:hypothetical protein
MDTNQGMDTSTITYNYLITKALFDNGASKKKIDSEIQNFINLQIELVLAYYAENVFEEKQKLAKLVGVFFKDVMNEQGQLGVPLIKVDNKYTEIQTISELKEIYIPSLNFREKMSIMRNFASSDNDCIMYSILIEYSNTKDLSGGITTFKNKYPMLNVENIVDTISLIENILGFDIKETANCYNDLQGSDLRKCTNSTKPYYQTVQNEYLDKKKQPQSSSQPVLSPITLCWLWHPLVYGVPYQDVVKLPAENPVKRINNSYKPISSTKKDSIQTCMATTYSQYPLFPPLSQREQNYIKSKGVSLQRDANGEYTSPPWNPPYCYMERTEPNSFMLNLQDRYKKYSVSNLSGHVMKFIIMAKYFNNLDLTLVVLASILFMVPYNHSIHEIFQAAKAMGVQLDYSIADTDLNNINKILLSSGMKAISLPIQSSILPPTTDKVSRRTPVVSYSTGGNNYNYNYNNKNNSTRSCNISVRRGSVRMKRVGRNKIKRQTRKHTKRNTIVDKRKRINSVKHKSARKPTHLIKKNKSLRKTTSKGNR